MNASNYDCGAAVAAQFVIAMKKDIDVDTLLANNQYDAIEAEMPASFMLL